MEALDDSADDDDIDRYVPPEEQWPEAHAEIFATANSEDAAMAIFRRHGVGDVDARAHARLIFAHDRDRLQALPREAQAA